MSQELHDVTSWVGIHLAYALAFGPVALGVYAHFLARSALDAAVTTGSVLDRSLSPKSRSKKPRPPQT